MSLVIFFAKKILKLLQKNRSESKNYH